MTWRERIRIGTSGWHYSHWIDSFYPKECRREELLGFYARQFDTVEVNNSFYSLPEAETLKDWAESVPDQFLFAAKASRYITHLKKLKDPEEPVDSFLERMRKLGSRLGPILFQLPPRWKSNADRLSAFLGTLPGGKYAFEFRDLSWFNEDIYGTLRRHGVALCIYDLNGRLSPLEVTADFVYVRLHGPEGPYRGRYDIQTLSGWAGRCSSWARQGQEVYCYFDNDESGYAAQNALELKRMLRD